MEQVAVQPVEQVAVVEEHLAHLLQQVALHPQRERYLAPLDLARAELHQQRVREERQEQQIRHQVVPAAALHIFTHTVQYKLCSRNSRVLLVILGQYKAEQLKNSIEHNFSEELNMMHCIVFMK